jgi:FixJ family two-component response regulator
VKESATISIVDDDEDVRLALQNFLRAAGCDVRAFDRAEAFLGSLEGGVPDCLITDLHMPGMSGLALQEELNRLGHSFPVIVMTAFPTLEAQERSAGLGASAFLSKPIDPEQMLRLVKINLGLFDD